MTRVVAFATLPDASEPATAIVNEIVLERGTAEIACTGAAARANRYRNRDSDDQKREEFFHRWRRSFVLRMRVSVAASLLPPLITQTTFLPAS